MKAAFAALHEAALAFPDQPDPGVAEMRASYDSQRAFLNGDPPPVAAVSDVSMPGPQGDVKVRIFYPTAARPLPAILYFHGGGWVLGGLGSHDRIMRLLARASGAAVVGVDYALAPEHPFPRPLTDCVAVARHAAAQGAAYGLDPMRIVLAGDSAGANLAAAAALALGGERQPWLKGLVSLYGVLDCDFETESYRRYADGAAGLSRNDMAWFWRQYVPDGMDRADPRLSPARADLATLSRLPPTLVIAAEHDVLLDDSRRFALRLGEAGVRHELVVYDGVCHGFSQYARLVAKARRSIEQIGTFCAHALSGKEMQ